jgi:outer membrane protein assembly factor BamB
MLEDVTGKQKKNEEIFSPVFVVPLTGRLFQRTAAGPEGPTSLQPVYNGIHSVPVLPNGMNSVLRRCAAGYFVERNSFRSRATERNEFRSTEVKLISDGATGSIFARGGINKQGSFRVSRQVIQCPEDFMAVKRIGLQILLGLLVAAGPVAAADWPAWRGPTGQGHSPEKDLPLTWGGKARTNILWKAPLPGQDGKAAQDQNQSSPIICRGRVFVTASYWPGDRADPKQFPEHHVACYHAADGKLLWDVKVAPGPWLLSDLRGGYTAPTPAADGDGERVYVLFGSAVLAALDFNGKLLWRKEINPYKFDVAIGTSPVLYQETILLQCDQVERASRFMAFDRRTGELKWERKRPDVGFSHSTPVLATIGGRSQLLVAASNALQGVDPSSGEVLWWCSAQGDTVSPVLGHGIVYLDSGRGGPGVAVLAGGSGDVTKTNVKWKATRVPEGFSSPVIVGDYLYRLYNPDVLKCWKLTTGEAVFQERLPGVSTASSPVATADGRIYFASAGKSYVVQSGPRPEVLAINDLGDGSQTAPAVANGRLFLKGRRWLFCIGKKE